MAGLVADNGNVKSIAGTLDMARKKKQRGANDDTIINSVVSVVCGRVVASYPDNACQFCDEHGSWKFIFSMEDESGRLHVVASGTAAENLIVELKRASKQSRLQEAWDFLLSNHVWLMCQVQSLERSDGFMLAVVGNES